MGVDVSPRVMIGAWFKDSSQAKEFAKKYDLVEAEEEGYDIEECLKPPLEFIPYTSYRDCGGCIGIQVGKYDLSSSDGGGVAKIWKSALAVLPKEVHEEIEVHIWAQRW